MELVLRFLNCTVGVVAEFYTWRGKYYAIGKQETIRIDFDHRPY